MGGQRGAAARAVGNHLKALVQKTLVQNLLKSPPLRLDKAVVIGYIGTEMCIRDRLCFMLRGKLIIDEHKNPLNLFTVYHITRQLKQLGQIVPQVDGDSRISL